MASLKITIQVPNSTRTSVKVISKTTKSTKKRRIFGEVERIAYTKKETIHLQIERSTEEDIIGDSMQNTQKKRKRQQKRKPQPKENSKCGTKRQKKSSETLQPTTAIKRKKKQRAKSVSKSNEGEIQENMMNDDKTAGLPDKILSSVAKEKQKEEEIQAPKQNAALKKDDVQSNKQTSRKTTNLSTPSFSLNLKDENSSQPDDFPATNLTYTGVNWRQLQVYKMLEPDEKRKITQFYSTQDM